MKEIEFNLLTEPWIRVRLRDNTVREVSLTEALVSAQDYVDLAGEMPTQNAAVLAVAGGAVPPCSPGVMQRENPNRWHRAMMHWSAGASCGSLGISRQSLSGTTWSSGRTASGCSTDTPLLAGADH